MNDPQLLAQLRQGDKQAYKEIYQQAFPMIKKWVLRNSGSIDDAHDMFQEALIVLLKMISRPDFQLKAKISTLLFPIANKLWLQSLKQQKRRKAHHLKMVNLQTVSYTHLTLPTTPYV